MLPIRQFTEVGLKLESAKTPFGTPRLPHIFGLDIQGGAFRMWKPDHVITQVQAKDRKMRQVVLTVREPKTQFTLEIPKASVAPGDRVIRTFRSGRSPMVEVERNTPQGTRHFLCGVDERNHPFIAQLPGIATSIQKAHELLKPVEVRGLKVKGHGKNSKLRGKKMAVKRQGEWFLIPLTVKELASVELFAKQHSILKNRPLGRGRGKPHTADEQILISEPPFKLDSLNRGATRATLYMRGKLRHVEHATLDIQNWMKVVRNTEVGGATQGATWVD